MTSTWRVLARRSVARVLWLLPLPRGKRRLGDLAERWLGSPAGAQREVVTTLPGFKMWVDPRDAFQRQIYYSRAYDAEVTSLFRRLIRPGDTVIDGGANVGYYSLLSARCVGPHGAVHAFEPIPQTFEALRQNIELNGYATIQANRDALSDHAETLEFEVPNDVETGNPIGWAATTVLLGRGPRVTVTACALDDYAERARIDAIKLVKLDLEGGELAAVSGMTRLLGAHRIAYLFCEVNPFLLNAKGIDTDSLRLALRVHGYTCYALGPRGRLRPVETPLPDVQADYLFVAPKGPVPAS